MKIEVDLSKEMDDWGETIPALIQEEVANAVRDEVRTLIKQALHQRRDEILKEVVAAMSQLTAKSVQQVFGQLKTLEIPLGSTEHTK